jgi:hypothetical protein
MEELRYRPLKEQRLIADLKAPVRHAGPKGMSWNWTPERPALRRRRAGTSRAHTSVALWTWFGELSVKITLGSKRISRTGSDLFTPMNASNSQEKVTLLARIWALVLEALKLTGIAVCCLLVMIIGLYISIKTGIFVPARWWGLLVWTCGLLWIVFLPYKNDLRNGTVWTSLIGLLALHLSAFVLILRRYPDWRMAWFPLVFVIEVPCFGIALDALVQKQPRTKRHSSQ